MNTTMIRASVSEDKYKVNGYDCYFFDDLKAIEKMVCAFVPPDLVPS